VCAVLAVCVRLHGVVGSCVNACDITVVVPVETHVCSVAHTLLAGSSVRLLS
jgi:hypothetical protein